MKPTEGFVVEYRKALELVKPVLLGNSMPETRELETRRLWMETG